MGRKTRGGHHAGPSKRGRHKKSTSRETRNWNDMQKEPTMTNTEQKPPGGLWFPTPAPGRWCAHKIDQSPVLKSGWLYGADKDTNTVYRRQFDKDPWEEAPPTEATVYLAFILTEAAAS